MWKNGFKFKYYKKLFKEKRGLGIAIIILVLILTGIIALCITLLLIAGEFDLSVREVFVFTGMIFGYGIPIFGSYLSFLLALVIASLI